MISVLVNMKKKLNCINFINRNDMYLFEILYTYISIPIVKLLSKTRITPNAVTIINIVLAVLNCCLLVLNKFSFISAFLMLNYYLLDTVDGALARCTGIISKRGAMLDFIADIAFLNLFIICIGYTKVSLVMIGILIIIHNFYNSITTCYIVPKMMKIKNFKRIGIKKYFMSRGIILGLDIGTLEILLTCAIVSRKYIFIYKLIILLYIIDILYRLIELWINEYLDRRTLIV